MLLRTRVSFYRVFWRLKIKRAEAAHEFHSSRRMKSKCRFGKKTRLLYPRYCVIFRKNHVRDSLSHVIRARGETQRLTHRCVNSFGPRENIDFLVRATLESIMIFRYLISDRWMVGHLSRHFYSVLLILLFILF